MSLHQGENENTPLIRNTTPQYQPLVDPEFAVNNVSPEEVSVSMKSSRSIWGILSVLLVGVFASQADTSLVLATYSEIASQFGCLDSASWLLSSYMLAMCAAQPLYGKLSDIFGRKQMLQVSYGLFALGTALCGMSRNMGMMIAGRAIGGVGGAGMVCLVSILLTDLVPLHDVASYRSYVNIAQTVGRSCGGAVGGWLAQVIGWKWAFLGQVPITILAMILVAWKLNVECDTNDADDTAKLGLWMKLKRIDFLGAFFMAITILSSLVVIETGGTDMPWKSPLVISLIVGGSTSALLFCFIEMRWAKEPIFPLNLLSHYDVFTSYTMLSIQTASQTALMLYVPLYFEVTKNASTAEAGAYLIPAVVGNTVGGLATGAYINLRRRYKFPAIVSSISSVICFTLLIVFWHGNTPTWECIFIFFGGLATEIAHSSLFVAVGAGVCETEMAIAGSGLYLSSNIGGVSGVALASATFQDSLRKSLSNKLRGIDGGQEIAHKARTNIKYLQHLTGMTQRLVIESYVMSIQNTYKLCLFLAMICFILSLMMRENRL